MPVKLTRKYEPGVTVCLHRFICTYLKYVTGFMIPGEEVWLDRIMEISEFASSACGLCFFLYGPVVVEWGTSMVYWDS